MIPEPGKSMFTGPPGATVTSDAAAAHGIAAALMAHAQSKGYHHSEILNLRVSALASNLASTEGVFVRFNSDNEEISRFGFRYIMFHDGSVWKIAVAIAHDAF